jgi:hypothetical protein
MAKRQLDGAGQIIRHGRNVASSCRMTVSDGKLLTRA